MTNVRTPVIDQVASQGALFQTAISSIPQTGPSHISMFTGQSPLTHGVRYNGQRLPYTSAILTRRLHDAGFKTGGFIGGLPLTTVDSGLDQGFQRYSDQLAMIDYFSENFLGKALLANESGSLSILAGSGLGGGTVINYTTSFRLPDSVADEWNRRRWRI